MAAYSSPNRKSAACIIARRIHRNWTIVADRIGSICCLLIGPRVKIIPAPGIVGLPSRVTRLEYDVGGGAVIAHDERNNILICYRYRVVSLAK